MPNLFPTLNDSCGVLSTPAMSTREVTPGKRPHGKHISSSLPISAYKADWHTQQWVIRRDDIFIYLFILNGIYEVIYLPNCIVFSLGYYILNLYIDKHDIKTLSYV